MDIWSYLAESFDLPILEWIAANLKCGFLDFLMPLITLLGDAGIFWMVCAALLAIYPKTRKIGFGMGFAMALGLLICNIILKPLVGRMRPYDFQIEVLEKQWEDFLLAGKLLIGEQSDFSFPSGHTIASFEACTVLMLGDKKLGIPATVLAILIAFSRMYLYVHYPTDVIASVILGTLFGVIGYLVTHKISFSLKGKFLKK
jgi:undecaprenyl-diphosphatase